MRSSDEGSNAPFLGLSLIALVSAGIVFSLRELIGQDENTRGGPGDFGFFLPLDLSFWPTTLQISIGVFLILGVFGVFLLRRQYEWQGTLATVALIVAVLGALSSAASGFGYQAGLWGLGTAFYTFLQAGVFIGLFGLIIGTFWLLVALASWSGSGVIAGLCALALGAAGAGLPVTQVQKAQQFPPIHDITTDLVEPPAFVAVVPLRQGEGINPAEYEGARVANIQAETPVYEDIVALDLDMHPGRAFELAVEAAEDLGWELAAIAPRDRRIEATHTSFWFGFKDDVVLRVIPTTIGTRIDMRSKSRVGVSDLGANAERIRAFSKQVREAAAQATDGDAGF